MPDKYLVINLTMFSMKNTVFLISSNENKEIGSFDVRSLPEAINALAEENNVQEVRILGNSKYAELVQFGIKQTEMTKYNKNTLNVEVVK